MIVASSHPRGLVPHLSTDPQRRARWTLLALAPLLVASLACGASGDVEPPAPAPVVTPEPAPAPEPEAEPVAETGDFPGCPGSAECMNGCRTRCETEHGSMFDLAALRDCNQRGGTVQECTRAGTNEPARLCFLTCRGLDPANFPAGGSP